MNYGYKEGVTRLIVKERSGLSGRCKRGRERDEVKCNEREWIRWKEK